MVFFAEKVLDFTNKLSDLVGEIGLMLRILLAKVDAI